MAGHFLKFCLQPVLAAAALVTALPLSPSSLLLTYGCKRGAGGVKLRQLPYIIASIGRGGITPAHVSSRWQRQPSHRKQGGSSAFPFSLRGKNRALVVCPAL